MNRICSGSGPSPRSWQGQDRGGPGRPSADVQHAGLDVAYGNSSSEWTRCSQTAEMVCSPVRCRRLRPASPGLVQLAQPPNGAVTDCCRQARSNSTAATVAASRVGPTVTMPWFSRKAARLSPMISASSFPSAAVRIRSLVAVKTGTWGDEQGGRGGHGAEEPPAGRQADRVRRVRLQYPADVAAGRVDLGVDRVVGVPGPVPSMTSPAGETRCTRSAVTSPSPPGRTSASRRAPAGHGRKRDPRTGHRDREPRECARTARPSAAG